MVGITSPEQVNPYREWVFAHPLHLLAQPSRDLLEQKRATAPGRGGEVVVELGCGSGRFLCETARRFPQSHFIGFELRYKRLVKAARKLEREGLQNVWLLRDDAAHFDRYFSQGTLDRVHIHFPDPWPKTGQRKKRLMNPALLVQLRAALKPGGELHLKTDHSGYFLHVLSLIVDHPHWRIMHFSNDLHRYGPPWSNVRTEFEQLFAAKDKPVFFLVVHAVPPLGEHTLFSGVE